MLRPVWEDDEIREDKSAAAENVCGDFRAQRLHADDSVCKRWTVDTPTAGQSEIHPQPPFMQLECSYCSCDLLKRFVLKSTEQPSWPNPFMSCVSDPPVLSASPCPPGFSPYPDMPRPHGGVGAARIYRHHRQRGGHEVHEGGRQQPGHQGPHRRVWRSALPARRSDF